MQYLPRIDAIPSGHALPFASASSTLGSPKASATAAPSAQKVGGRSDFGIREKKAGTPSQIPGAGGDGKSRDFGQAAPGMSVPTATIRLLPEDFVVEELPAYAPSGRGEHLFVTFRKRGLTTLDAVRQIARALDVDPRGAGF